MRGYWLVGVLALALAQASGAATDADRVQVYREFRGLFDAHHYQEALPFAQRVVALTEEQYGDKAPELVNPLTNLGTTYHRLGQHQDAEKTYLRCIQILEATSSSTDRQLLRPLHGLGVTYVALGQYDDASLILKRAVDLSRNLNGLFGIEQLDMLDPLIRSYVALGDYTNAEKEHQYAFEVAEAAYGKDDARLVGPLERYAGWFEFVGRYTTARAMHARALSLAEREGRATPLAVDPLRGIARTYWLEYLNGPEEEQRLGELPLSTGLLQLDTAAMFNEQRSLNPDGEHALQLALDELLQEQPPNHARRGETWVDFGDWYLVSGNAPKAADAYRSAWKELQQSGSTALLSKPRVLAYRPPASSATRSRVEARDAEEHHIDLLFTVNADGRTTDVRLTESDAPEAQQKAVLNAVKRARYGPRLENGEPVATTDVALRERVVTKKKRG
jgi:TonB family protein